MKQKPTGKKKNPISQKEQSERFVETAQELEVDESGEAFDSAIKDLLKPRQS